jgi:hypothetical protein
MTSVMTKLTRFFPSTDADRHAAENAAKQVAKDFSGVFADSSSTDKARLQKTMAAIVGAYAMLKLQ